MSSWIVELTSDADFVATIALIDSPGPLNDWRSQTAEAFTVESGAFTNQGQRVVACGCGVVPCWARNDFDIDAVSVGQTGDGNCNDAGGTFGVCSLTWKVIARG